MRDFTLKIYRELLSSFLERGYKFITFEEYCDGVRHEWFVVLRHDVDLRADNSFETAMIENSLRIRASYYFRVVEESNCPDTIRMIKSLGHEIGYHYEDMSLCGGNPEGAVKHFKKWLAYFRGFYPVRTVCMHGAPTSKYDSKDIWCFADYHDFGIVGEPYFDTDFSDLFYITDTGRCWDGYKVSVRDKIPKFQDVWSCNGLVYHSTMDVINAMRSDTFPKRLMMTTHPQRWNSSLHLWWRELLLQNAKNVVKRILIGLNK